MSVTVIDDPADPRVAVYRDVRERDLVGREGRFIAEGEVVLRALVRGGRHGLESVLAAERRAQAVEAILAEVEEPPPLYLATQPVLDAITGFHLHRGILGVGRRAPEPDPGELLAAAGPRALVLALFGIGNHDNMGGLFRNAAAFGADAVLLDPGCCDPLYRKAIRVSVGAALTTPFARLPAGDAALDMLQRHRFEAVAMSPAGETPLHRLARPERAALLMGAEGPGLPDAILARCRTVSIPMASGFDSLNVATAAGVALHRLVFG